MSGRVYALVSTITTAVAMVAVGLVTFFNPPYAAAWVESIPLIEGCTIGICSKFVSKE